MSVWPGSPWYRRLAWLALAAMVFGALAPSVSKLLVRSGGVIWVEVCSASSTRWVAIGGAGSPSDGSPMVGDSHCGYCVLQQHSPVLPVADMAGQTHAPATHRLAIGPSGTTVYARFTRRAHLTRGPPAMS